jgi:uncharacterized protein
MQAMGRLLQQGRPPSDLMALTAAEDERRGLYAPCPCGSGRKFRFCHGDHKPLHQLNAINVKEGTTQHGNEETKHPDSLGR